MKTQKKTTKEPQFHFTFARDVDSFLRTIEKDKEKETKTIQFLIPKSEVKEKTVHGNYHTQQILFNVDFRFGHDGLNAIARQNGIDLKNLKQGNILIFFNSSKTAMKVAFSDEDVFFHKQKTKIEERTIPDIMKRLNNTGKVDYPAALSDFLKKVIES